MKDRNIYYLPDIEGQHVVLDEKESGHCIKVLRSKIGDKVYIIDGKGGFYEAEIKNENPRACELEIIKNQQQYKALDYELTIAIAPTKSIDRFEWFVEKATEIGVSRIVPIITRRSERRNLRTDRIRKLLISAIKQSGKAYLPELDEALPFEKWIKKDHQGSLYISHCMEEEKAELWSESMEKKITILIGPEGDFTSEEVDLALKAGFKALSLGDSRLRTETAGVFACASVLFANKKTAS